MDKYFLQNSSAIFKVTRYPTMNRYHIFEATHSDRIAKDTSSLSIALHHFA